MSDRQGNLRSRFVEAVEGPLGLNGIHRESPFESLVAAPADLPERLDPAGRQFAGIVDQAVDQRRFAVIDMADQNHLQIFKRCLRHSASTFDGHAMPTYI